jgi:hypothetical protein
MKRVITLLVPAFLLSFGLAHAQQPQFMNCDAWMRTLSGDDGATGKAFYLAGFSDGVGTMAALSAAGNEQHSKELVRSVWPAGLNIAQMKALIDEYCERPENKGLTILESVVKVNREINERRSR